MDQVHTVNPRIALVPEGNRDEFLKLEEQAQLVLSQITELRTTVARIRAQQNAFLPAVRVPDDILIAIFSHMVYHKDVNYQAKRLLIVTSVCSRWRAVATAAPGLWTSICLWPPKLASLFLTRSRPALLSINAIYSVRRPQPKQFTALVGPWSDRIRNLRIDICSHGLYKEWMDCISALPAPALQHLGLRLDDKKSAIGLPIFANETPSLRSLVLEGIVYPPTSPLFSDLRHLSLHGVFSRDGYQILPLLEILSRSPDLETLALDWAHPLAEQYRGIAPGTVQVPLTRLRSFRLVTLHPCALRVMHHLGFSDETTYDISVYSSSLPAGDAILDHPLAFKGITFLRYTANGASREMMNTRISAYREEHPPEHSTPVLLFRVQNRIPQVSTLLDAFDLRSVVRFKIQNTLFSKQDKEDYWYEVLKQLPALRTLLIVQDARGPFMVECLSALVLTPETLENQASMCVCPVLEHLELQGAVCEGQFWPVLESVVTVRSSAGVPLKSISLSIARGAVDEEYMGAIRERVDTVVVHGP